MLSLDRNLLASLLEEFEGGFLHHFQLNVLLDRQSIYIISRFEIFFDSIDISYQHFGILTDVLHRLSELR